MTMETIHNVTVSATRVMVHRLVSVPWWFAVGQISCQIILGLCTGPFKRFKQPTQTYDSTCIVLQPDGVQRGLVGEIIKRFEQRGYTLKGLKLMNVERALAEKHYADLSSKPFFPGLVDYIISGPVVAMVGTDMDSWLLLLAVAGQNVIGFTSTVAAVAVMTSDGRAKVSACVSGYTCMSYPNFSYRVTKLICCP